MRRSLAVGAALLVAAVVACAGEDSSTDLGGASFGPVDLEGVDDAPTSGALLESVTDLAVGEDGIVWGAGSGGVMRYDPAGDDLASMTVVDGLPSDRVTSVVVAGDGTVWAGTDAGPALLDGDTWSTVDDGLAPDSNRLVVVDSDGGVWSLSEQGPARLEGGEWVVAAPFAAPFADVIGADPWPSTYFLLGDEGHDMAGVDGDGALWSLASADDRYLTRWDGESWSAWKLSDAGEVIADGAAVFAVEATDRGVWLIAGRSIVDFDGDSWSSRDVSSSTGGTPRTAALDHEGRLWIGSAGGGLTVLDEGELTELPSVEGAPDAGELSVYSLARGADPYLWIGTGDGRVARFDPATVQIDLVSPWLEPVPVGNGSRLAVAPDGALWSWDGDSVWRFDGVRWTRHDDPDVAVQYYDVALSPDGVAWLATDGGVARFDGDAWRWYGPEEGVAGDLISAVASDDTGVVYAVSVEQVAVDGEDGDGGEWYVARELLALEDGEWSSVLTSSFDVSDIDLSEEAMEEGIEPEDTWLPGGEILTTSEGLWLTGAWTCRLTGEACLVEDLPAEDFVVVDLDGSLWAADSLGVHHYEDGGWSQVASTDELPVQDNLLSFAVGSGDEVYLGTQENGVLYSDGSGWWELTGEDGVSDRYLVGPIIASPAGGAWAVAHSGLMRVVPVERTGPPPSYPTPTTEQLPLPEASEPPEPTEPPDVELPADAEAPTPDEAFDVEVPSDTEAPAVTDLPAAAVPPSGLLTLREVLADIEAEAAADPGMQAAGLTVGVGPCVTGDASSWEELDPATPVGRGSTMLCTVTIDQMPGDASEMLVVVLDDEGTVVRRSSTDGSASWPFATPAGYLCRDYLAAWYGDGQYNPTEVYVDLVAYWFLEGMPDRMDIDGNGIPCELLFPRDVVTSVWSGGPK